MLNKLSQDQIQSKIAFIKNYIAAPNAADGSLVDANANVTRKTMATMEAELHKFENIQINRALVTMKITEMFGQELADKYIADIEDHLIYIHDETSLKPYCASITMYPFLFEGTKNMGGTSTAPKNLQSFCGSFVNLVYQVASNFAGAVATVEFLMYFDYYARKTYGDNYLYSDVVQEYVVQEFQGVVYALNQPSSARGDQSVFWNISVFDEFYFDSLFGDFYFPDGSSPNWKSLSKLQELFLDWFRLEREKELLTFPVVTAAMLIDKETKRPLDSEFEHIIAAQMSKGLSFFIYQSESADSLASCCRLRNELADNSFSYSLGAGGVSTGSKQVITINFNRMEQKYIRSFSDNFEFRMRSIVERVQKYLMAHNEIVKGYIQAGLLPAYTAGYISESKQFLTIGINGAVEGAEFYRLPISCNDSYKEYLQKRLGLIFRMNKEAHAKYGVRFNTEFVPGENLGVKNAAWDKADGLKVNRNCYNSYFYQVENPYVSLLEKVALHGKDVSAYLDGGAALHLNLEQHMTYEGCISLIRSCAKNGVPYWTWNVLCTICDDCTTIDPNTLDKCPKCGSQNVDYGTRVIGFLKRISDFSKDRKVEATKRYYAKILGGRNKR